ncbi:VOC family protein [Nafulsella turpanensis]|uniref:VOC family protein n=1 Tax=Nafulsella turpanensis TaxID=1265690 RepID=UPI0003782BAC|nr:VOC family protein [Nafulsella turpanensis]
MNFSQIKESCLYISDVNQTEQFYHGILGLPVISKVNHRHIFFRVGRSVLLCFLPEVTKKEENLPPHFAYGKQHLAFETSQDDYQGWKQQLEKKGIEITHEQGWKEGLQSFYFEDPDGHVLEVVPEGIWE